MFGACDNLRKWLRSNYAGIQYRSFALSQLVRNLDLFLIICDWLCIWYVLIRLHGQLISHRVGCRYVLEFAKKLETCLDAEQEPVTWKAELRTGDRPDFAETWYVTRRIKTNKTICQVLVLETIFDIFYRRFREVLIVFFCRGLLHIVYVIILEGIYLGTAGSKGRKESYPRSRLWVTFDHFSVQIHWKILLQ